MSESENAGERGTPSGGRLLWVVVLLTVGLCIGIALDVTPWLRGPSGQYEWRWYHHSFRLIPLRLLPVAVVAGLVGGWYWLARKRERAGGWLLAALVPLSLALQLSVLSTGPKGLELVARVLNPGYFGYYPDATRVENMAQYLDTYADNQPELANIHLQVHPPGNVVFLWGVYRAVAAVPALTDLTTPYVEPHLSSLPDWITDYSMTDITGAMVVSLLIPFSGALAVVPLYLLARTTFEEETARRAALLYVLSPALTLFEPKMNVPYLVFTGLAFLLAYRGHQEERLLLTYLSGLVCSVAIFMSYSNVLLPPATGIFVLAGSFAGFGADPKAGWRRLVRRSLAFVVGVWSVQVFMTLAFGWDQIRSIEVMFDINPHYDVDRNYWYNLFYTPYSMLLLAGIPVGVLAVARVVRLVLASLRREKLEVANWFLIGTILPLVVLMLSGNQRGENERVFLYFMPVTVLFGAAESTRLGWDDRAFGIMAGLTFLQLMVFQAVLEVYL